MSFVIWKICACYSFKYFFCNFLSSPYGIPIKHVTLLYKYIVLGYSVGFLFFFFLFSFLFAFQFGKFYSHIFKFTDSFFGHVQSSDEP